MQRDATQKGYALVALIALMAMLALFLMAAAPSIQQQNLRVREIEAIHRGEEVAEAISLYVRARQTLPTSMDQLIEGIPQGTKKVQILRTSAAKDPLSTSGEWRLIRPIDPEFIEFQRAVTAYAGGAPPPTREPLLQPFAVQITNLVNTPSTEEASDTAPRGEIKSANSSGPFIGVASRSRRPSVLNYYGINRHDGWVFTPLFR